MSWININCFQFQFNFTFRFIIFCPTFYAIIIFESIYLFLQLTANSYYFVLNSSLKDDSIPVYNSASVSKSVSNGQLMTMGMKIIEDYPFEEMMWRPSIRITKCFYYFYVSTILEQVLPAIIFDALLDLIGKQHK